MEELKLDCLLRILERLTLQDLITAVPFVCPSWYKASLNSLLWKDLDLSSWDTLAPRLKLAYKDEEKNISVSFKFLKFVVSRSGGSAISLHFPYDGVTLEDLTYGMSSGIGLEEANAIITNIPKIKSLDLSGSLVSYKEMVVILMGCKELEELNLKKFWNLVLDYEMFVRAKNVKNLQIEKSQVVGFCFMDANMRFSDGMELAFGSEEQHFMF
ncbi:hypothetical protein HHK36_013970 [Tetracentron sinense]|uniref:F-box domain-containing protein n=1 Tax=Tetracentron sinense TaxID=13715 RepID=A0A834Z576_TETSI|nr:hypothetical protein HHK36_013970 [Tetracentron sinense]